ncbi:MAG: tripartite tricarboxylate transporter substrate binding protein, partial [Betaproteobacteria bacterium]|nr:tripartite tricarboxylate transporter substrate binding protein [Betaproteobacteria bacterium]
MRDIKVSIAGYIAGLALFACATTLATAADFPSRQVRIVVPFPPGSGTDVITRLVADRLARKWAQPVVVDNRPGAASIIGSEIVARALPDGYTLLMTLSNHASNPRLYAKLPYDTERDFQPVTQVGASPMLMLVNPALNVNSVGELIALSKR